VIVPKLESAGLIDGERSDRPAVTSLYLTAAGRNSLLRLIRAFRPSPPGVRARRRRSENTLRALTRIEQTSMDMAM